MKMAQLLKCPECEKWYLTLLGLLVVLNVLNFIDCKKECLVAHGFAEIWKYLYFRFRHERREKNMLMWLRWIHSGTRIGNEWKLREFGWIHSRRCVREDGKRMKTKEIQDGKEKIAYNSRVWSDQKRDLLLI